ncbi:hypothetical protein DIPPA_28739 [Diplonema papillatum]|nr:hypothetical protein DIPPA_28739 [Diplonema papillatum]|eukprot:gene15773-24092_t
MLRRMGVRLAADPSEWSTTRFQYKMYKLGDQGARRQLLKAERLRDAELLRTAGELPLVKSASEGFEARPVLDNRDDAFSTKKSYPKNTIIMYADCLPDTTRLSFVVHDALSDAHTKAYTRHAKRADQGLLGDDVRPVQCETDPNITTSPLKGIDRGAILLEYDPRDSGYADDACAGYAAAQQCTHDALHHAYQKCLDRRLVAPRRQLFVVLRVRGMQRGRGGVFHAVKENPHLLQLVDVEDCTVPHWHRRGRFQRENAALS